MSKIKEHYLNNLTPEEIEERMMGDISAFEYVELMDRYKDVNEELPDPTDSEIETIERMVEDYYASKEFREYVENYQNEHNQFELDEINDSVKLKYTDNDILYVLDGLAGPTLKGMLMAKLNDVWNTKNGVI